MSKIETLLKSFLSAAFKAEMSEGHPLCITTGIPSQFASI